MSASEEVGPLEWLRAAGQITRDQYWAAQVLQADLDCAHAWLNGQHKGRRRAARCRMALLEIAEHRDVVLAVVGDGRLPAWWANGVGLQPDDGLRLLRAGLDALVEAYARMDVR